MRVVLLLLGMWGRVAVAAPCESVKTCEPQCASGTMSSCVRLGDLLAAGYGNVVPDHAGAAALYAKACNEDADTVANTSTKAGSKITVTTFTTADGNADGCLALARLVKTGWFFEVERDPDRSSRLLGRALSVGAMHCSATDTTGCTAAAAAVLDDNFEPSLTKAKASSAAKFAEQGCKAADMRACDTLAEALSDWDRSQIIDDAELQRLGAVVDSAREAACSRGNGVACLAVVDVDDRAAKARAPLFDKACSAKDPRACMAKAVLSGLEAYDKKDAAKLGSSIDLAIRSCDGDGFEQCTEVAYALFAILKEFPKLESGRATQAAQILERRCAVGDLKACRWIARTYRDGLSGVADQKQAEQYEIRVCLLTPSDRTCNLCESKPTGALNCRLRAAYEAHVSCTGGRTARCTEVGERFAEGRDGVPQSFLRAARSYQQGCEGAQKAACSALTALCDNKAAMLDKETVCAAPRTSSLIYSNLFNEAEYQFRTTGTAALATGELKRSPETETSIAAPEHAPVPESVGRGHLDANLVIDVIVDRARQAAVRLVVEQLEHSKLGAKSLFLQELLQQGAALLADPSTLRRDQLADLAMTVVRAFVAANLVDSTFPSIGPLLEIDGVATVLDGYRKAGNLEWKSAALPSAVRTYLIDMVYRSLASQPLFARGAAKPGGTSCRYTRLPESHLCGLAKLPVLTKALEVDRVLEAIKLAKAVLEAKSVDLRRFIEAVTDARAIADFGTTPGLVLKDWRRNIVTQLGEETREVKRVFADLRSLLDEATYSDTGPEPSILARRADAAIQLLPDGTKAFLVDAGRVLDSDARGHLAQLLGVLRGRLDRAALRKQALELLGGWRERLEVLGKLDKTMTALATVRQNIDNLEIAISQIEGQMQRIRPRGAKGDRETLDLADVPLQAIGDLRASYSSAASALKQIDTKLLEVYPGAGRAQVQFTLSAVVRLLGLFDVIDRIARVVTLDSTCADLIASLRLLGSRHDNRFATPVLDILDPVLDRIKLHEPMSVELLFGVLARVRLDTLLTSIDAGSCTSATSVECWTVKVVHALQQSIVVDGTKIKVDGGQFVKLLATQGDDFRRTQKWRGFLHLTVGAGVLASEPAGGMEARRGVPVIAEQVGFGIASPTQGKLTFKFGIAASGVLYRAIVDSVESDAIMLHPGFVAVDIADLIEVYATPTILFYPPTGSSGTEIHGGFSMGVNIPLSAYLERRRQ
jgi:hypothetical protein